MRAGTSKVLASGAQGFVQLPRAPLVLSGSHCDGPGAVAQDTNSLSSSHPDRPGDQLILCSSPLSGSYLDRPGEPDIIRPESMGRLPKEPRPGRPGRGFSTCGARVVAELGLAGDILGLLTRESSDPFRAPESRW